MSSKKLPPENNQTPSAPLRYALYRRVSTEGQDDKDISLPAQRRQQLDYVTKEGGLVSFEFEDAGISGRTAGRAQFQSAITAAKARQYDVLLIHKSDRVFRNRDDAYVYKALLKKFGVSLASVTEPWVGGTLPGEQLMEGVMECINEFYSANLSLEVKKGLREIAEGQGRQTGWPPYGYGFVNAEVQGSGWQVIEEEAAWVRWMYTQFAAGDTCVSMARQLNTWGVPTYLMRQRGKKPSARPPALFWHTSTVRTILSNPGYLGRVQYRGEWFAGAHPSVVEEGLWETVQTLFKRRGKGRVEHSEYGLFVGKLLRCPHCGGGMIHLRGKIYGSLGGRYNSRYRCAWAQFNRGIGDALSKAADADALGAAVPGVNAPTCAGQEVAQSVALRLIQAALQGASQQSGPQQSGPSLALRLPSTQGKSDAVINKDSEARRGTFLAEMSKLMRMRQGYLELAASGDMRLDELRVSLTTLQSRMTALEASLAEMDAAATPKTAAPLTSALASHLLQVLSDEALTIRQKRDALRLSVSHFVIWPDKSGVDVFLF